jgi:hypothetical protein
MAAYSHARSSASIRALCRKWFTIEEGQGRSDKQYCSNACRMRAYRKRKASR